MTRQTVVGSGLIIAAVLMFASGVGDTVKDLTDWHGLGTPAIIGALLKQLGQIGMAALGGTLLPPPQGTPPLTVDLEKVGHL